MSFPTLASGEQDKAATNIRHCSLEEKSKAFRFPISFHQHDRIFMLKFKKLTVTTTAHLEAGLGHGKIQYHAPIWGGWILII